MEEQELKLALNFFSERPGLVSLLQEKHVVVFTHLQGPTCKSAIQSMQTQMQKCW